MGKGEQSRYHGSVVRSRPGPTQLGPGNVLPKAGCMPRREASASREQRGFGSVIPPSGKPQGAAGPTERPRRESGGLGLLTSMIFSFFFWSAFLLPPAGCCCFLGGMAGRGGAAPAGLGPGREGPGEAGTGSGRAAAAGGRRNGSRGARWERAERRPIPSRRAARAA